MNVPITINEDNNINRKAEPITIGVPFAKGKVKSTDLLSLYDKEEKIPCQINTTTTWNDGSIKWIILNFQTDIDANSEKTLNLIKEKINNPVLTSNITTEEFEHYWSINTGNSIFYLSKTEFKPLDKIIQNNKTILNNGQSTIRLKDKNNAIVIPVIKSIKINNKQLYLIADIKGIFFDSKKNLYAKFLAVLTFYKAKSTVKLQFTIHNPNRAYHPENLWDLGDKGAIYFNQLDYQISLDSPPQINWKKGASSQWEKNQSDRFVIYQDSSGGELWDSKNHINKDKRVPLKFKGYQCLDNQDIIHHGNRVNPFIHIKTNKLQLTTHIKQFWQNFPKAIEITKNNISIALFPKQFSDNFELQGGEKKTHTIFLNFSEDMDSLDYCQFPLIAKIPVSYYAQTNLFSWMPKVYAKTSLDYLINAGIEGENNFFSKREVIDEYGWRNFGDLFADHESLYRKNNQLNISHYNNQYDRS